MVDNFLLIRKVKGLFNGSSEVVDQHNIAPDSQKVEIEIPRYLKERIDTVL